MTTPWCECICDKFCAILSNPFSALAIIGTSFEFKQELIGTSTGQNWNIFELFKPSLHPYKVIKMRNICVVNDSTENKSPEGQQESMYPNTNNIGASSQYTFVNVKSSPYIEANKTQIVDQ